MSKLLRLVAVLCLAALPASSALALNILLCNDDGITAANVRALKEHLAGEGHSVIVTAPIDNQSGTDGFIHFLQPIGVLTGNERGASALGLPAGTPGVGTDPSDPMVFYVNGTPEMACLYGIDVQSAKVWLLHGYVHLLQNAIIKEDTEETSAVNAVLCVPLCPRWQTRFCITPYSGNALSWKNSSVLLSGSPNHLAYKARNSADLNSRLKVRSTTKRKSSSPRASPSVSGSCV